MINVSQETINKYYENTGFKKLTLYFPDIKVTLDNSNVIASSLSLTESLCESTDIEYVGCIATCFQIEVADINRELRGQKIEVKIDLDNDNEPINLFNGYVTDVKTQESNNRKKLTCYDSLYAKYANFNVSVWYNSLYFPCTMGQFRRSLFTFIGLDYIDINLPADKAVLAERVFDTNDMMALDVLKQICQINGVFGIINRDNKFEFRRPDFLSKSEKDCAMVIDIVKSIKRSSAVHPLKAVELRDSLDDPEYVIYPGIPQDNECMYVIEGNMFTLEMPLETREGIAISLENAIKNATYTPFNSEIPGYPFLEVGDRIAIKSVDYSSGTPREITTYTNILSRTLKGFPGLLDSIEAQGEENSEVIITSGTTFTNKLSSSSRRERNMEYLVWKNVTNAIVVKDGENLPIMNIALYITADAHICIDMQFVCLIETLESIGGDTYYEGDCELEFLYYLDGTFVEEDKPVETCVDGHRIIRLRHDVQLTSGIYHWQVFIKSRGGTLTIAKNNAQCIVNSDGLRGEGFWDGTINCEDIIEPLTAPENVFNFTDNVDSISLIGFPQRTCEENINPLIVPNLFNFTDNIDVDSNLVVFNSLTNVDKIVVHATLKDNVYSNGNIVTDEVDVRYATNITIMDNRYPTYMFSFDGGNSWYGYDAYEDERWVLNYDMSSQEVLNMSLADLRIKEKAMIKITMPDAQSTFSQLEIYGGKFNG